MNCGLTNLDTLKKHLLAGTLLADKRFDTLIADIGLGVAAQFDDQSNRLLRWQADDTYTTGADRTHVYLPRYPFVSVTQVELKTDETTGWVVQPSTLVLNTNPESGLVYLGAAVGSYWSLLRFTYSGGYWFDTLEPDDESYPGTLPEGATALPDHVRLAFLLQCRRVWALIDKLGTGVLDKASAAQVAATEPMAPTVADTLRAITRYAMT